MEMLQNEDFEVLDRCPWDGTMVDKAQMLYTDDMGCDIVRCSSCGVVFAKRRLSPLSSRLKPSAVPMLGRGVLYRRFGNIREGQ